MKKTTKFGITALRISALAAILAAGCNGPPTGSNNGAIDACDNKCVAVGSHCNAEKAQCEADMPDLAPLPAPCGGQCGTGTVCDSATGVCGLPPKECNGRCGAGTVCNKQTGNCDLANPSTPDSGSITCGSDTAACGSKCVDLNVDPANCGACGNVCPANNTCQSGKCVSNAPTDGGVDAGPTCAQGQTTCSGKCVDLQVDVANCGMCGTACPMGNSCAAGKCTPPNVPPVLYTVIATPGTPAEAWVFSNDDVSNVDYPESTHIHAPPSITIKLTRAQICQHTVPQNANHANKIAGLEFSARVWDVMKGAVIDPNAWFGTGMYPALTTIAVTIDGKPLMGIVNATGWNSANLFISWVAMKAAGVNIDCP